MHANYKENAFFMYIPLENIFPFWKNGRVLGFVAKRSDWQG
jgi:hypothetical protein